MEINKRKEELIKRVQQCTPPNFHVMWWPPIKNSGKYRAGKWTWDVFELWKRDEETLELIYAKCSKAG